MKKNIIGFAIFLSAFSLIAYVTLTTIQYRWGFPLDDAWIHQTYARNLFRYGEWSFIPGSQSVGSTSPLWVVLLAVGYWIGLNPLMWSGFLGWMGLFLISVLAAWGVYMELRPKPVWVYGGALLMLFEWHLVWAALSGMETILSTLICLFVILSISSSNPKWSVVGLTIGIGVWVRPDMITLAGPCAMAIFFNKGYMKLKWENMVHMVVPIVLMVLPYFLFNYSISNMWFPATFYAKQAEYSVMKNEPLILRLLNQLGLPLIGVGVTLVVGAIYHLVVNLQKHNSISLWGMIWFFGFVFIYSWRLPVTYQHGRYLIPAMPILWLYGYFGFVQIINKGYVNLWIRVITKSWVASSLIILFAFWALGRNAYAKDVMFVEYEMVDISHWVKENIEPPALIAAHDIGALGYFVDREILDLAGLINPEIIPIIRDEAAIGEYLKYKNVKYLVVFPYWYPELVKEAQLIYQNESLNVQTDDYNHMAIYLWR